MIALIDRCSRLIKSADHGKISGSFSAAADQIYGQKLGHRHQL